jgi:hypothetical protein
MSISVSVMAHPSRAAFIPYIFEKLGREVPVAWDRISNRWDTGRRAWQLHDPEASHHLVLQDDVILSRDLPRALPKVIAGVQDQPISLFARNKKHWNPLIQQCLMNRRRVRWMILQRLNWGPAVLLPVADIAPMLAWVDEHCHMPNYDVRIGYWYLTQGRPVWYTMPSLVDHRIEGDSLVWNLRSQAGRYAKFFIGEEQCGADLNWKGQALVESISLATYLDKTAAINDKYRRSQP